MAMPEKSFMLYSKKISQSPKGMPMAEDTFEMTVKGYATDSSAGSLQMLVSHCETRRVEAIC